MLLGTEGGADLKDTFQPAAHAQLLEQLRRLVQESRCVEVHHREQIRSAFGGRGHDFRGVCFDETLRDEMFATVLKDLGPQAEHGVDVRPPEVKETVVESCVQTNADGIGDPQWKRSLGLCDDRNRAGQNLVRGRWRCFAFFGLRRALLSHGAGHGQRALTGQALEEAELIFTERVGFGKDLRHARAVAKVSEADGTLASAGMQKPGNGDLLADKVRAFALDVAKRVGAVGRGVPRLVHACRRPPSLIKPSS